MTRYALFCILVSGYTQSRGTYHGILRLREELVAAGFNDGTTKRVWYVTWKTNWKRLARDLATVCTVHGLKPKVLVAGYSYGGWGALRLAKALEPLGVDVDVMVLSDPVGRPWWWPRPLPAITSLLSRYWAWKLRVAPNVHLLHSYYQQTNRPQGHLLKATNGTKMTPPVKLPKPHERMDDAAEFHGQVSVEAWRLRKETEGHAEMAP